MIRLVTLLSLILSASSALAQEKPAPTIEIGLDAALPGERASLSVRLAWVGTLELGSVRFELAFPDRFFSFVDVAKRQDAEASDVKVKAEVVAGQDAGESILRVELSASTAIPQGLLAELTFTVSKEAPGGENIPLKTRNATARARNGSQLNLRAVDGTIAVLPPTPLVVACFFYMH